MKLIPPYTRLLKRSFFMILVSLLVFQHAKAQQIWTVTNLGNTNTAGTPADNNVAAKTGSLRFCLANCPSGTLALPNEIRFAVAGTITQSGYQNEEITKSHILINGFTAPGAVCGYPTVRFVTDGTGGWLIDGGATNIVIKGMSITGWFRIEGGANLCQILGCNINTASDGLSAIPNSTTYAAAIRINGAGTANNTIGGLNDCDRNIICAGTGTSVARAVYILTAGTGNKVLGNYCGVDKTGYNAIGNYFSDRIIHNDGASTSTIEGNVLSNAAYGIFLDGASPNCILRNNMIGADKDGKFQNSFSMNMTPITLWGSNHSTTLIDGNVLGNCTTTGDFAQGSGIYVETGFTGIQITNNYIGIDKTYNIAVGRGPAWCGIYSRSGTMTISGNYIGNCGIRGTQKSHGIGTENSSNFTITNNYIGVTPTGGNAGNGHEGIEINGSNTVTISGNVVGFNQGLRGVTASGGIGCVNAGVSNITIDNNYIGVTPTGLNAGNNGNGVWLEGSKGTQNNFIISNNKIAFNQINGVGVTGTGIDDAYITNNCMWCNGTGAYAATGRGISIPASNNSNFGGRASVTYSTPSYGNFNEVKVNAIGAGVTNTDTSTATWIIRGFAPPNSSIELFVIDECHLCTANGAVNTWLNEGQFRVGTGTTNANGLWAISIPKADIGRGVVATATGTGTVAGHFRTSDFSNPICFNSPCMSPKTATLTTNPNPPTNLCTGTALNLTGSYTVPSTGCQILSWYGSFYKDGSLISGPTLLSPPTSGTYSISSLALTDAGTYTFKIANVNPVCALTSAGSAVTVITCGPTPVTWRSFYGVNSGEKNSLFFTTGTETSNSHFEIERSNDGINFEHIGTLASAGSSGATYTFDDTEIEQGLNYYYRIKQVDVDFKYTYSEVISISTKGGIAVKVYPNPAGNSAVMNIISAEKAQYRFEVSDLIGRTFSQGTIDAGAGLSESQLDFTNLANGVYVLKVSDEKSNVEFIKIEIQK